MATITPATITGLSSGSHSYRLTLTGYQDVTGNATITAGQTTSVTGTFTGNASITSTPSNARIWIDGSDTTLSTPNTITGLSAGTHSFTLKLTGYADYSSSFTITSGQTTNVSATFTASAYFTSTPSNARIWIDGSDTTLTTPNTITGLSATTHSYTLKITGYQDVTGNFTAISGQTVNVPVTFLPSLNITSTPSGASIYIDNTLQTGITTPAIITGLSAGSHSYTLKLTGYTDFTDSFTATSGSTTSINATFAGSAYLTSIPTNASLYLDGNSTSTGTTPITITNLTLPISNNTSLHSYILKLTGYADVSGSFTATAGQTINVPVTFPGSANISSIPSNARIWIDGSDTSLTTPNTITGLSAGSHSYILKLTGYADYSSSFTIISGQTTNVSATFAASAYFISTPSNARIWIDGTDRGINTPNTITGLSAGSHSYILKLTGYADYSGSFTTTSGTTTSVPTTFAGSAYFTSVPTGGSIYLDGSSTPTGTTPLTIGNLTLPISNDTASHSYILKLTGYADTSGSFTATAGSTINVPVTFPASAYFTSTPSNARIWIDNIDQGVNTPNTITNLSVGTHSYILKLTGYADATGNFTAIAGQTTNIPVTFPASAYITSTPTGADIWIDGSNTTLTTPNTITGLSPTSHSYTLKLTGYADATGTFTAVSGQTVNVPVTFAASAYFTSTPPGARIYIDGTDQGVTTPGTVTGFLAGDHSYTLKLTGYADATGTFTAVSGQTVNVTVTFAGSAHITSTPSGAEIWIDGIDQGLTTPNTVTNLSTGSHSYALKLTGYLDVTGSFSITAGTTTHVSGTFTGNLDISSLPTNATIYIDNILKTETTPATFTGLTPTTHSYTLKLTGYADATGTFTITSGQTTNLPVTFSGSAYFTSLPTNASIYIDGTLRTTTPGTITGLTAGNHSYTLRLTGYADATGTFTAVSGQTVNVPVTFAASAYFTSVPTNASIYLDGSPTPLGNTPITITGLSPTSHSYNLRLTGYADATGTFTAVSGQTINVPVTFAASAYITSNPSGAEIWIDNNDQGVVTPGTITGLSPTSHSYSLKLTDYADITGTFTATSGQTITISPTFLGSLNILSNPSGAEIWIDNIDQGMITPDMITGLSAGIHNYTLKLDGYADYSDTFTIVDGEITIISIEFLGNLDVGSIPIGASIYLDDNPISLGITPKKIMGLTTGTHNVLLKLTNYYDWIGSSTIANANTTVLNATLIPKYGSLNIKSTPNGADIFIDNSSTKIGITNSPSWTIIPDIAVGSHPFKLSHIDYGDVTGSFDIYPNQITYVTATLDPSPGVPPTYAVWDPSTSARLRVYKCKKIDIEQLFLIDGPTLSFDYQIKADADPEIIRWQLIVGGNIVIDNVIPATSYGISTGTEIQDVSPYLGLNGTIKLYVESGPDCKSATHENTYLWIDNVTLI